MYLALAVAAALPATTEVHPATTTATPTTRGVPDTLFVLPRIVVEAERLHASPHGSGFVARVELDAHRARVEDLAAVLSQLVGVRVTQYGGLGDFATVSIRGSSSSQVKVYLDGVPIEDTYIGVTDLSQLPLGGVQRVDVYRGAAPLDLGSPGIGGALNLVTWNGAPFEGDAVARAEVHESYGSFDTSRHRASVWVRANRLRLFAHGGYARSLGDFDFDDDNGTEFTESDDAVVERANNDFDAWSALVRAEADVPRIGVVSAGHDVFRGARGVPGLGVYQSASARSQRWRRTSYVRADQIPVAPRLTASATAFYSRSIERFDDPDGTIALTAQDTDNTFRSYGGRGRARWLVARFPAAFEAVFEGRQERFHPVESLPDERVGPDRWRRSTTTALGAELYLLDQTLVASGAARVERQVNEYYDDATALGLPPSPRGRFSESWTSPSAGLRWQPTPRLAFKANAGRYHRLPTFLELFGNTGAVTGNADLSAERGVNRDVGVVWTLERAGRLREAWIEFAYLDNEVDDMILFFPNSQRTSRPVNIGAATVRGVELSAAATLGAAARLAVNYTFLDTEDTGGVPYYAGNELPSRPRHDANAVAAYALRSLRVSYEFHYLGANYLDRANLEEAPARALHNVIVEYHTPLDGLSLTVEGRNLTDDRVSDVGGFPLPGRSFYSTLSYRHEFTKG